LCCRVIQLEDNDVLHMVKGDYAIFNMAQPDREQAVERVHQVLIGGMLIDRVTAVPSASEVQRACSTPQASTGLKFTDWSQIH
jgi:hypothetical protein